uniref:NADH dehydrogenase subunit 6 n=1 Tax=Paralvinella hessleri TaxID=36111 RepID=A0A6H0EPZ2_9ANNE|nr:NADH dehydrogenase subunit 6 [Paralvinella hessleri]
MLQLLILATTLALSVSMPMATTPLTLGLWVLGIALMMASWISSITLTWFSMILFLIYISGMLVMFAYFVAMTPNFTIPNKLLLPTMGLLLLTCTLTLKATILPWPHFTTEHLLPTQQFMFQTTQSPILIFLVVLLFLAMVLAVKISDRNQGPLRPFN